CHPAVRRTTAADLLAMAACGLARDAEPRAAEEGRTPMADTDAAPYGRQTQREPAVKEVHVLWTPDGLGCDGDTISTTAATQPSIEDIVMEAIPGLPKVHLHNRVLDYSLGGKNT